VTQFFYDGIGRLTNVVDAAGKPVYFTYDNNGNRTVSAGGQNQPGMGR
jgi:YD repeat-containing protein